MSDQANTIARFRRAKDRLADLYRFWRRARTRDEAGVMRRVAIQPMMMGLNWSEYGDAEDGSLPVRLLHDPS